MADLPVPTAAQVEAVLRYLPALRAIGSSPSQWHEHKSADGTMVMPWEEHAPEVTGLTAALYVNGFVVDFDWPSWQESAERYVEDDGRLTTAGIGDLQRLLTTHVRKDRFCEGHFADVVRRGHIAAVLERLAELRRGTERPERPSRR